SSIALEVLQLACISERTCGLFPSELTASDTPQFQHLPTLGTNSQEEIPILGKSNVCWMTTPLDS
nr:hypothetical protein [bacterium]